MKFDYILSQTELISIAILSALIAWEFYKSVNGRLRIIMIELFLSKILVYGGSALFRELAPDFPTSYMRLLVFTPMFLVMCELWYYMKTKTNSGR